MNKIKNRCLSINKYKERTPHQGIFFEGGCKLFRITLLTILRTRVNTSGPKKCNPNTAS